MTITSRINLKNVFEDGDTLDGDNLANLIDSFLHLTDSSAQSITSPITFTGSVTMTNLNLDDVDTSALNAARISTGSILTSGMSATFVSVLSALSAQSVFASTIAVGNTLSAKSIFADRAELASAAMVSARATFLTVSALVAYSANFVFETTTVATSGAGGPIPASVAGYIIVNVAGAARRIPFFNA